MSMIPMGGNKISPNPWLVDHYPDAYLSMGLTAERVAARFGITRDACDEFSLRSHRKALRRSGGQVRGGDRRRAGELHHSEWIEASVNPKKTEIAFKVDEGPRADTSIEALGALKAAFHVKA